MARRSRLNADTFAQSLTVGMALAAISHVLVFGRGILFARMLDAAALGTWALMASAINVGAYLLLFGVPSGLKRYTDRYRREGSLGIHVSRSGSAVLGVGLLLCAVGLVSHRTIGRLLFGDTETRLWVILTAAGLLATMVYGLARAVLQGMRLLRVNAWVELYYNVAFLPLALILLVFWTRTAAANAVAYLAVTLGGTVAVLYALRRAGATERPEGTAKQVGSTAAGTWTLGRYAIGSWTGGAVQMVWQSLDRYMLLHLGTLGVAANLAQIGDYFIVLKLASPLAAAGVIVAVTLVPHAAHLWEDGREREVASLIRLTAKAFAVVLTFSSAILMLFHRLALQLFVGRVPETAGQIIGPVVVTVVAVSLYFVYRAYLLCREHVWLVTGAGCVALVANVVFNLLLIPRYNLVGAVLATMISANVSTLLVLYMSVRQGLAPDRGTWMAFALPLCLLLPPAAIALTLGLVTVLGLGTTLLLTRDEKRHVADWYWTAVRRLPMRRRRMARTEVAAGPE